MCTWCACRLPRRRSAGTTSRPALSTTYVARRGCEQATRPRCWGQPPPSPPPLSARALTSTPRARFARRRWACARAARRLGAWRGWCRQRLGVEALWRCSRSAWARKAALASPPSSRPPAHRRRRSLRAPRCSPASRRCGRTPSRPRQRCAAAPAAPSPCAALTRPTSGALRRRSGAARRCLRNRVALLHAPRQGAQQEAAPLSVDGQAAATHRVAVQAGAGAHCAP